MDVHPPVSTRIPTYHIILIAFNCFITNTAQSISFWLSILRCVSFSPITHKQFLPNIYSNPTDPFPSSVNQGSFAPFCSLMRKNSLYLIIMCKIEVSTYMYFCNDGEYDKQNTSFSHTISNCSNTSVAKILFSSSSRVRSILHSCQFSFRTYFQSISI